LNLFGKSRRRRTQRWFFATDVHGSDRCYRKFLAAARVYEADVLLLGGDVAGKGIVPIVRQDGLFTCTFQGDGVSLSEEALSELTDRIRFNGLYPYVCDEAEKEALHDEAHRDAVFGDLIAEQLKEWVALTEGRLDEGVRCIITPGNDDPGVVDEVLMSAKRIECPERKVVEVGPAQLASLGNTNRTPWATDREYGEEELAAQIDAMLEGLEPTRGACVFNFHCPPYDSGLDTAAKLDESLRPVVRGGNVVEMPVGSTAVRESIVRYQPAVALHGHIHEARGIVRIGKSQCLNPGSDYSSGVLKGALVDLDADGQYMTHMFTTG
jgi:Icc-related predicted phosphoesterase